MKWYSKTAKGVISMWIEIADSLINLDTVIQIKKDESKKEILFTSDHDVIRIPFKSEVELQQVYFNILADLKSVPVDGFRG